MHGSKNVARSVGYNVVLATDAQEDLVAIHDFLVESYIAFGEDADGAFDRADARLDAIKHALRSLGSAPKQGTLRPEIAPDLRSVTKDRAVIYFDVDDERETVKILAVFYGGQDHQRHMLQRALAQ